MLYGTTLYGTTLYGTTLYGITLYGTTLYGILYICKIMYLNIIKNVYIWHLC